MIKQGFIYIINNKFMIIFIVYNEIKLDILLVTVDYILQLEVCVLFFFVFGTRTHPKSDGRVVSLNR